MKKNAGFSLAFLFFLAIAWMAFGQDQKPEKPWLLTQDQINGIVNAVRAGKDLTPPAWPEGAKVGMRSDSTAGSTSAIPSFPRTTSGHS